MVIGEATPATAARRAELKKKLMAGAIFAIVDVAISIKLKAPRCRLGISSIGPNVFPSTGRALEASSGVLMTTPLLSLITVYNKVVLCHTSHKLFPPLEE